MSHDISQHDGHASLLGLCLLPGVPLSNGCLLFQSEARGCTACIRFISNQGYLQPNTLHNQICAFPEAEAAPLGLFNVGLDTGRNKAGIFAG